MNMTLFDAAEGQRRKEAGIARASSAHAEWLEGARLVAVGICRIQGTCTADDLRAYGVEPPKGASANIMGGIFRDKRFTLDGYAESERPVAHGNLLRRWRLA